METVLILSIAGGYGGAEKSIEIIIQRLAKTHRVIVCVEDDQHRKTLKEMGLTNLQIIPIRKSRRNILFNLVKIFQLLHNHKLRMCLANTNKGAYYLALLSLVTQIDMKNLLIYVRDFQWRYLRFITYFLRNAKYLLPTQALLDKDDYIKRYINKENFFITGDPVLINQAIEQESEENDYILALANIAYWKGLIYLLKAYNKSGVYNTGVKLKIYGSIVDRKCYNELLDYINACNLSEYVAIKPFAVNVDDIYEECRFVVNSSISDHGGPETFGRTIIEAWSHSKTVIAFKAGGPKYLIDSGRDGFLVPEKDIDQLAEKMTLLVNDRNLAQTMGAHGHEKALENFSAEKVTANILRALSV